MLLYNLDSHMDSLSLEVQREKAQQIPLRINQRLVEGIQKEFHRSPKQYQKAYLGDTAQSHSPLTEYPVLNLQSSIIGHFQISPANEFHTPFFSPDLDSADFDFDSRQAAYLNLKDLVESFKLSQNLEGDPSVGAPRTIPNGVTSSNLRMSTFKTLSQHNNIIYYRTVKYGQLTYIQGFVIDATIYLKKCTDFTLKHAFPSSIFDIQFYSGETTILDTEHIEESPKDAILLIRKPVSRMIPGIDVVVYPVNHNPYSSNWLVLFWGLLVSLLLIGGLFSVYRLMSDQIALSKKRADFISAISHEFKTPLTSIQMYSEMLEEGWVTDTAKIKHYSHLITSESNRLSRLITNILTLSNFEHNQWPINPEPTNVTDSLQAFMDKYKSTVEERGFIVEVYSTPTAYKYQIDQEALFHVLLNLAENAIKFSYSSEIKKLIFSLDHKDGDVYLSIRDFGPGVPKKDISKIFDDFYRVESEMTRTTKGTGIGLSLVKHLCRAMDIQLLAQNSNPGLTITLIFRFGEL